MTQSDQTYLGRTAKEWTVIEAKEHDEQYADCFPFGGNSYNFSVEQALRYEDYCYKPGRERWGHRTRKFLDALDLRILPGKKILDIGSGTGQLAVLYALHGARVTGIELSSVGSDIANRTAEANGVAGRCNFITGDFTEIELPEGEFDIVTLHAVLHHLIKYPGIETRINRALKSNGKIFILDTVRGGLLLNRFRKIVRFFAHLRQGRKVHEENLGDLLFGIETYHQFGRNFARYEIQTMDYFYMINKIFQRTDTKALPARLILRIAKVLDDIVIHIPGFRNRMGNALMVIEK